MLFFFDFANYFKMLRLAWNEPAPRARSYYLAVLVLAIPIVSGFHALCFFLDGLLFPGLRRVDVKAPVFLVGHARSGTTLTHRLMSMDEGRFSYFLLWECYFPSLLQKKLIRGAARFDRRWLGGVLARAVQRFEERRYGPTRAVHEMGLGVPEEDDIVLYYSMASGFWITRMPYMADLDFYHMNDWPEARRRRYNRFYRDCVRRQLYLNGPHKTHLSKNPLWAGRVASLIEAFPDARFIVNVRDPRETIPSLLKLVRSGWKRLDWDEERQRECLRILAEMSFESYRHPIETLDAHPEVPHAIVDYRELTADPAHTIERVYEALGLPLDEPFRKKLAEQAHREKRHRTGHHYSLEEFGLEADAIRQRLGDLFERFGWDAADARPPAQGEPS